MIHATREIKKIPLQVTDLDDSTLHLVVCSVHTVWKRILLKIIKWIAVLALNRGMADIVLMETRMATTWRENFTRPVHEANWMELERCLCYKEMCID